MSAAHHMGIFMRDGFQYLLNRGQGSKGFMPFCTEPVRKVVNGIYKFAIAGDMRRRRAAAMDAAGNASFEIPMEAGMVLFPPGKFDEFKAIRQCASGLLDGFDAAKAFAASTNPYMKEYRINGIIKPEDITMEHPFMKLAMREDVLAAVANYFGFAPILNYIDIWYSPPLEKEEGKYPPPVGSQLYHSDWTDLTSVRIFIFLSDIDENSGPLTVIPAEESRSIREKTDYRWGRYVSDDVVEGLAGKNKVALVGPEGTIGFADPGRCFHYGSRHQTRPRIVGMIQYVTPYAYLIDEPFRKFRNPGLSGLQNLALGR